MANIYLHLNGEQKGPYSEEEVRAMLAAEQVTSDTLAWREGLTAWSTVAALLGPPPAPLPVAPPPPVPEPNKGMSAWLIALLVVGGLLILSLPCCCGISLGPIMNGIEKAKENMAMQQARQIGLAMFAYAHDHNGNYPDAAEAPASGSVISVGNPSSGATTSTEVFQKLLDQKYVTDPAVFYLTMPGKVRPVGDRLLADNVCFDVTAGLTLSSPSGIPMTYTTGFKVDFGQKITIAHDGVSPFPTFVAFSTGNIAHVFKLGPNGSLAMAPPFNPFGGNYRQLKP